MEEQCILVADKDTAFLREVSDHFSDAGYRVETTSSAAHVISNILEKQTPVVMLGSDFDKKISMLELVRLLEKCNRHLAVILISDEALLPIAKRIRKKGVFYYALRPINEIKRGETAMRSIISKISMISAVLATTAIPALAVAEEGRNNHSEPVVWIFLGMCALIIIAQIAPLIRNLRKHSKIATDDMKSTKVEQLR